jgi:putative ABC transport system permease protein
MGALIQDLRYAWRVLIKSPVLAIAVVTQALGIGANVAIFTLVNSVVLQPLPFREPDRLVRIFDDLGGRGAKNVGISVPELEDLRDRSGVFEQVSAIFPISTALSGGDRVERIELLGTHPSYFEILGAKAALGRVYSQADWVPGFVDGVVISDGLWKREFGSDPRIIGRRIRVDEDGYTIIGVMPSDFRHPGETFAGEDVDLWAAAGFRGDPFPAVPIRARRFLPGAMGRLKPGVTLKQAQGRLDTLVAQLQQTYPTDYPAQSRWSVRLESVQTTLTGNVRPTLVVLLAAVSVLLMMVCVNIASLLIARSSARTREFAIRQALGASRGRLVRQALTECVLISLAGGAAAILVLRFAQTALLALVPADVPRLAEVHSDWHALTLALALSIVTGVLFGLAPAAHASATDPNRDLKEGGRVGGRHSVRQTRSRAVLVTVEVAVSVMLLIGAGLLVRSFFAMLQQRPGLEPSGLTVGQIWIPFPNDPKANRYRTSPQRAVLVRELLRQLDTIPGVQGAAMGLANDVPFLNNVRNPTAISFPDDATTLQNDRAAIFGAVSPNYFEVLGVPLLKGRDLTAHDEETTKQVVVANESFARAFSFPGRALIGRTVRIGVLGEFEIVGVVADVRDRGLDGAPAPRLYASIFQASNNSLSVFLRTRSDPSTMKETLAQTVHNVDGELPVFGVRTMAEMMSASMARRRFSLFLMSAFAAVALLLAALGIYGVMDFVVSERTQEFGIRSALGARPREILMLALRPGLVLASTGVAVGVGASLVTTRLMSSLLFGVSAADPFIFALVPVVLVVVAAIACAHPARRATSLSPMEALRG